MQITNITGQYRRNTASNNAGINRYITNDTAASSSSSRSAVNAASGLFSSIVSVPASRNTRGVATGTNRVSTNRSTTRSNGLSAYRQNSSTKSSIMQSAQLLQAANPGRQAMASYLSSSINSPVSVTSTTSTLSSLITEGIRQYSVMQNGISSNFNVISRSAGIYRSIGGINANSGSLFNFI